MPDATRTFNGLTGAEIRTRLLQELEARPRDDTRLGAHLVFPVVTWTWRLELEASPPAGAVGPGADGGLRAGGRGRVGGGGGAGLGEGGGGRPGRGVGVGVWGGRGWGGGVGAPRGGESAWLEARGPRGRAPSAADVEG